MTTAFEQHYKIAELAEAWKCGAETVRRMVMQEDDVMRISGPTGKTSYRVPESVARRIHTKLMARKQKT